MSGHVANWTLAHSPAEGVLRMVLVVLAHAAADDGEVHIRLGTVAHQAALPGKREADQALGLLGRAGLIRLHFDGTAEHIHCTVIYPGNDSAWLTDHLSKVKGGEAEASTSL